MSSAINQKLATVVACLLVVAPAIAQGPGSCGFHLDIITNDTSTHASVADAPNAPGGGGFIYPPGAPGNPYQAYATPGSTVKVRMTVPVSTLGPGALGPGRILTIIYSVGTPAIAFPPSPGLVAPCFPGEPLVIQTFPFGGAIVDGIGLITAPAPPTPPADPGHPSKFEVVLLYPAMPVAVPIHFQAVIITPSGLVAVSNGTSLLPGPNPFEMSLLPLMAPCSALSPLDEGFAGIPTPPGFFFYGFPQPVAQVVTNPFVEFAPFGVGPATCDFTGSPGDLGCPIPTASASPRVAANHYDADWSLVPPGGRIADVTLEVAPPMSPFVPTRHIIRWKAGVPFGGLPPFPDTDYASVVVELWGDDAQPNPVLIPGTNAFVDGRSRVVIVRQETHQVSSTAPGVHHMMGIGPGPALVGPCTPIPMWTLYGAPFISAPFEAVYMDPATFGPSYGVDSATQESLALVCDPLLPFPSPAYVIQNY